MSQDFIGKNDPMTTTEVISRQTIRDVGHSLPAHFQVRATKQGFIGWLIQPGDVFTVARENYSDTWMEIIPEQPHIIHSKELADATETPRRSDDRRRSFPAIDWEDGS